MKRTVYEKLLDWKSSSAGKTALMIDGARRVGKSWIVMEIDFLVEKRGLTRRHNISPIEVKCSREYTTTSLDKFRKSFASSAAEPFILHEKNLSVSAVGSFRVVLPNLNYGHEGHGAQGGVLQDAQGGLKGGLKSGLKSKRKTSAKGTQKSALNATDAKIVEWLAENARATIPALEDKIGLSRNGIKKALKRLKDSGVIRRIGPDKGGHWEVVETSL